MQEDDDIDRYDVRLTDENLVLLMRGGVVSVDYGHTFVRVLLKSRLKVINVDDYRALKQNSRNPHALDSIFEQIDS